MIIHKPLLACCNKFLKWCSHVFYVTSIFGFMTFVAIVMTKRIYDFLYLANKGNKKTHHEKITSLSYDKHENKPTNLVTVKNLSLFKVFCLLLFLPFYFLTQGIPHYLETCFIIEFKLFYSKGSQNNSYLILLVLLAYYAIFISFSTSNLM